jgi:hypothetical protein
MQAPMPVIAVASTKRPKENFLRLRESTLVAKSSPWEKMKAQRSVKKTFMVGPFGSARGGT